jgi:hypothetical protein
MKSYLAKFVILAALVAWSSFTPQITPIAFAAGPAADVGHTKAPIFTTKEKIVFTLKTDYGNLWKHRAPPNTEVPEDIKEFEAPGQLSWTDSKGRHDLPVQVHLRGNTSQVEAQCPFPKMTLSFEKEGGG